MLKKNYFIVLLALILFLCSCKNESLSDLKYDILNQTCTKEELSYYDKFISDVHFKDCSGEIAYFQTNESVDKLSEIGLKGTPVLICKSIDNERGGFTEESIKNDIAIGSMLSRFRMYTVSYMLRVDYYDFVSAYKNGVIMPSENYYAYWKYAKEELPKIAVSDISAEEKLDKYVEFGFFAVPYVKEELEKGNTEYENFFSLVGAHLSTADYMKVIEITEWDQPMPTEEEIEKSLLESGKDFDYKKWLNENEEDLNNLYKFLDEYVKDYESKTE